MDRVAEPCPLCGQPPPPGQMLAFDDGSQMVRIGPATLHFTSRQEYVVLEALYRSKLHVATHEYLAQCIWPIDIDIPDEFHKRVNQLVSRVRAKLRGHPLTIRTFWGIGYTLAFLLQPE